jgi:hypothetical protein
VPHDHCPPNLRGHTWKPLPQVKGEPWIPELRKCARCGALGRVSKQGIIHVMEAP